MQFTIIRYGSRVKWSNPGKGVAPSPTPWCSKLSKREPSGHPRLWSPTLLTILWYMHKKESFIEKERIAFFSLLKCKMITKNPAKNLILKLINKGKMTLWVDLLFHPKEYEDASESICSCRSCNDFQRPRKVTGWILDPSKPQFC